VAAQIAAGDRRIIGTMIESHLVEGRQDIGPREQMTYGQGVTDACIGWDDTLDILRGLRQRCPASQPGRVKHRPQATGTRRTAIRRSGTSANPGSRRRPGRRLYWVMLPLCGRMRHF
jgi:hypothetical protein